MANSRKVKRQRAALERLRNQIEHWQNICDEVPEGELYEVDGYRVDPRSKLARATHELNVLETKLYLRQVRDVA